MRQILVAIATVVAAATSTRSAQEPPTFRGGVGLVELDVSVTDQDGQAVRDLRSDDFEVLDGGRPQVISAFSYVDIPLASSQSVSAPRLQLEPDVTTNSEPEGRVYVLLMDAPSTASPAAAALQGSSYTARAKQVAQQFVRTAMQNGDQVAVVHARGTFTDSQGFTTSRRLIERSIDRYGRGLSGNEIGPTQPFNFTLDTYRAIEDLSIRLGTIRARRKGIVWIGGQIDIFPELHGYKAAQVGTLKAAYEDAMRAAARNNVAVYAVDPTGLTPALGTDELQRMAGLRAVAEDTGGLAVVNTSNFTDGFAAIIRDMSSYYLLGYVPTEEGRDGTFRPIQVRVKRPGVTVRARTGYYAGKATGIRATNTSVARNISAAAVAALASPVATRGLKVGVITTVFRADNIAQPVVIGAHVNAEGLALVPNASLSVAYQLLDVEGHIATGHYKVYRLDLRPQTRERAINAGLRFLHRATLRPGRYELRLVVEQPGTVLGSVVSHVTVPDLSERLDLSEIALGKRAMGTHVMLDLTKDDGLAAVLSGDPVILRRFRSADTLLAFVESYARVPSTIVNVSGSILNSDGQTVARASAQPADAYASQERTSRGHLMTFDLSRVEPGDHVLTVTARSPSQPNQVITRQVRIAIDP